MRYFSIISSIFVAILLISNTIATKLFSLGPFVFTGAIFVFPISYIFGDILVEVYGYSISRRIIWTGFACLIFMSLTSNMTCFDSSLLNKSSILVLPSA